MALSTMDGDPGLELDLVISHRPTPQADAFALPSDTSPVPGASHGPSYYTLVPITVELRSRDGRLNEVTPAELASRETDRAAVDLTFVRGSLQGTLAPEAFGPDCRRPAPWGRGPA